MLLFFIIIYVKINLLLNVITPTATGIFKIAHYQTFL